MAKYKEDTFIFHLLEGPFSSKDISKFRFLQVINSSRNKRYYLALEAEVYEPSGTIGENLWNFQEKAFYVTAGYSKCVLNDTEGKVQAFCDEHQCKLHVRFAPSHSRYLSRCKNPNKEYLVFSGFYKKKNSSEKLKQMINSIKLEKPAVPWWQVDVKTVCNDILLVFYFFAIFVGSFCMTLVILRYFYGKLGSPKQNLKAYNIYPTYDQILLSLCPVVV